MAAPEADKDAPAHAQHRQRLRARFLSAPAEALPDYELLELLLFYAIDRVDVKPLAKELLREFGGLGAVLAAPPARLARHKRVNERVLALFLAVRELGRRSLREGLADRPLLSSWDQLLAYCRLAMADEPLERFRVLYLNRKNILIADEVQGQGTIDHTPVYPREVIKRALELGAAALIVVHNHPSGDPTPSRADIEMTQRLCTAAESVGVVLHDHVIVGKQGAVSLRATGQMSR